MPSPVGNCKKCPYCKKYEVWWQKFDHDVDDLVWRSNRHSCGKKTCMKNNEADQKTGHINLKKGEAWINTFTPTVTYLLRCNSDVTSLLSGTAIKAVIAYVTDYVSKSPLKTYGIFESIRDVFDKNTEMLNSEKPRHEKAYGDWCPNG
ncbi:hypothetical protein K439DRAFT_1645157 [Ramaria rubella]|nr:hypothetical protein K439DRAFT_1645157 [Ramaria rubella]